MNADFKINGRRLETERLILRAFQASDLKDFYEYASEDGLGEMAGWKHHESMEETKEILDLFIREDKTFAILLKDDQKVIGSVGVEKYGLEEQLTELSAYKGREIGYVLGKAYWGRGIMPEAVNAVIRYLFHDQALDFLLGSHYAFNRQSRRVQEKSGFKPYRKVMLDTHTEAKKEGVLNILLNPDKNIVLQFPAFEKSIL